MPIHTLSRTFPPAPHDRLLTIEDLVARLRRCKRAIYEDVAAGRIPAPIRIGRSVRWRESEIAAWIAAGCPPIRPQSENGAA
ncbi:MAG: helix-turn-helix domain-containing protein [Phycisphaeraceae bacterium]|nr:helix-turn-helix domain-containing protein [Phycisphaeraceae bacterium]